MDASWSTQPILGSHLLAALLTAALLVLLLAAPNFRRISAGRKRVLTALRLAVILLALVAMLRPARTSTTARRMAAAVIVMFDASRSMQLPAASGGRSRWEEQRKALEDAQKALGDLPEGLELRLYAYDRALHPVELDSGGIAFPETPDGDQTDIGSTLAEAIDRERGNRVAAVFLLGDGAQTAFEPRVEIQQAGRQLDRAQNPLYSVAFGPAADAAQAKDVAVESLPEQYTVFVKNQLLVSAALRVRGYVNQPIPVELLVTNPAGETKSIGSVELTAREDGEQIPIEMTYTPEESGQYKLTLRAAQQSGELAIGNNELTAFATVLEGGLKVLYLSGEVREEQKFIRRAINDSPDIELHDRLILHRNRDNWPDDLSAELSRDNYDAFIFGDLDSAALRMDDLAAIATAVESGKGLIMLGGYHSFGPGGYQSTPFNGVLPIEMSRFDRQDFDADLRTDLHLFDTPQIDFHMLPVREHPVTHFAAGPENERLWRELPELLGANRFTAVKDNALVLAETPAGAPLLVAGTYGSGRVLAMAGDSTFRWRKHGFEELHSRFWRQVILWLLRREELTENDVWVKMRRRRFDRGAQVTFTAGAKTAAGQPIPEATLDAVVVTPNGERQQVRLARDGDNFEGRIDGLLLPGDYAIEVAAKSAGGDLGTARADFQITSRDAELSNPAADRDQLARLAGLTKRWGGRIIAPEQLTEILNDEIEPPEADEEIETRWRFADTPADAWLFLVVLVGLLGTEWWLRKKWGLV